MAIALDEGLPYWQQDRPARQQAGRHTKRAQVRQARIRRAQFRRAQFREAQFRRAQARQAQNFIDFDLSKATVNLDIVSNETLLAEKIARSLVEPAPAPQSSAVDAGLGDAGADAESASPAPVAANDLEPRLVKESFARVAAAGTAAIEYFYARLFATNPSIRSLFPMSMTEQRELMFAALTRVIASLDSPATSAEILGQMGREHRKFGVTDRHHHAFFSALRDTVRHFAARGWTPEIAAAWQVAADYMSAGLRAGAAADAAPRWWLAEITGHELRSPGVAVLRLRPTEPFAYRAGQYVPVQVTRWPRIWRPYSIAAAPRRSGVLELHVKAVPGGLVSNTLAYHSAVGDCVVLGPASGELTLADSDRDLLCIAGGTGLAPIKAIIEQVIGTRRGRRRKITLFLGAQHHFDLYDLADLELLEAAWPELRVVPVLSDEPDYSGLTGMLPDVVRAHGLFENTEAYVCGPAAMVSQTAALLAASLPAAQIHHDPLPLRKPA